MLRKKKKRYCDEDDETSKIVNDIGTSVLKKAAANAAVATPTSTPTANNAAFGTKNNFTEKEVDDDPMISVILKQMQKRNKPNEPVDTQFSQSAEDILKQINDFLTKNKQK